MGNVLYRTYLFETDQKKENNINTCFCVVIMNRIPVIKSKKPEHTKRITPPEIWGLQKNDGTKIIIGEQKSASVVFNYEHMVDYKEWGGREGESYVCTSVYSSTRLVVKVNTNNDMRLCMCIEQPSADIDKIGFWLATDN